MDPEAAVMTWTELAHEYPAWGIVFAFLFGSCFGSFLNVCIWRIPLGESVIFAPSHCPKCNHHIKWYENIPLISYLALRGRCSECRQTITIRYFLVELLTAVLFAAAWAKLLYCGQPITLMWNYGALLMLAIPCAFIDVEHRLIPNKLTYTYLLFGLIFAVIFPENSLNWSQALAATVLATAGTGVALWCFRFICNLLAKTDAFGLGDIKYMMAVAALCNWRGAAVILLIASIFGTFFGIGLMIVLKDRKLKIPFAPFLAVGVVIYILGGDCVAGRFLP